MCLTDIGEGEEQVQLQKIDTCGWKCMTMQCSVGWWWGCGLKFLGGHRLIAHDQVQNTCWAYWAVSALESLLQYTLNNLTELLSLSGFAVPCSGSILG